MSYFSFPNRRTTHVLSRAEELFHTVDVVTDILWNKSDWDRIYFALVHFNSLSLLFGRSWFLFFSWKICLFWFSFDKIYFILVLVFIKLHQRWSETRWAWRTSWNHLTVSSCGDEDVSSSSKTDKQTVRQAG